MLIFNMKKFIRKSILFSVYFILFFIFVNSAFLLIIALTDWDFVKRLESLRFDNPDYDLLVLGTSLAEYGVDTEMLTSEGIISYNLALVGSSNKTSYIQLKEYLSSYSKRPKYVLLALNSHLEQFDQEGIQPVVEFTMKNQKIDLSDVPISKFNWAGMELLKKALYKQYRHTQISYGQKQSIKVVPDNTDFQNLDLNLHKYESAIWIGKMAELCDDNGILLVIVDIPGVEETQNNSNIGPFKIHYENGYSAELYNFSCHDFCKFIQSDKDWGGMSHLNKYGAEKFTHELIDIIFRRQYP